MIDKIRTELSAICQRFSDPRLQLCRVEVTAVAERRFALTGELLDAATAAALLTELPARFAGVSFETKGLRILRSETPQMLAVAVNLTSLHAAPSFLAEQISQMLNGAILEVLEQRERWVFVRQEDGYLGWTYQPYLVSDPAPVPTHLVVEPVALLHIRPDTSAPLVGRVLAGTFIHISIAQDGWMQVMLAGGQTGWMSAACLRSLADLPTTAAGRRQQMAADAGRFTGVPYLWGGAAAHGIDCSGFVQLLHRLVGVTLPRDADMQASIGVPIDGTAGAAAAPPYLPGDLFFFSSDGGHRKITHVGMSLGGWRMIHSSRARNGVYEDDVNATPHLRESFAGARRFL